GLAFGAILPTMQTWMFNSVESKKSRLASATYYNFYDIGIGAGAVLLGYMVEISGFFLMFRVAALFVVLYLVIYMGYILKQRRAESSHTGNER
ncbi:MAG: MFS transporter, partial [Firmicutes bacterium]|nr:MFS transporter [Bacillota bacterium]